MRVLKWTIDFQLTTQPFVGHNWIGLVGFPIHLLNNKTLFFASFIGKPMKIGERIVNLSKLT